MRLSSRAVRDYDFARVAADFGNRSIWTTASEKETARLDAICELVPTDVASLLDVGCGAGAFLGRIKDKVRCFGTDLSPGALELCEVPVARAALPHLPISDGAFECVSCMEVLEHLPDELLDGAVAELLRVTSKYLLITVPNDEQIAASMAQCADCGAAFSVYGHLQRFDTRRLLRLAPGTATLWCRTIGPETNREYPGVLLKVQHAVGIWDPSGSASCPNCGSRRRSTSPRSILARGVGLMTNKIGALWNRYLPKKRPWLAALYQKTN